MEIVFIILGILLLITGFIGCLVPIIPGVPLAWASLLLLLFSDSSSISITMLIITAIVSIAITVIDNIAPVWLTKKKGGTKAGLIGSTIGIFAGIFFAPVGIILCPLLGAFIGELIHDRKDTKKALSSAWASFLGFLVGTGLKMIVCSIFAFIFFTQAL